MNKHLLFSLVLTGLLFGLGYKLYRLGFNQGSAVVQARWDEERLQTMEEYERLFTYYAQKEAEHRLENNRIANELENALRNHDAALASLRSDYEQRLLLSTNRAALYQRQAEAGAASCLDLASHAAQLDRSLEEGRGLVRELGETLRLRDQQLKMLGEQIINDRKLIEAVDGSDE